MVNGLVARRLTSVSAIAWPSPAIALRCGAIAFLAFLILYPLAKLFGILFDKDTHAFAILSEPGLLRTLVNTLEYTVGSTLIALVLGLPLAWILSRRDDRLSMLARSLISLAFILPEFIYAIAYAFLLEPNTGYLTRLLRLIMPDIALPLYGLGGMCLITGLFCVPQIIILVEPALRNIGSDLEEAAETCGAGSSSILWRVTLPLSSPAILTATLLTFLLAFASFGIPAALGIPVGYYVLSTDVFSMISTYPPQFGQAAVLSFIFLAVSFVVAGCQIFATRLSLRYRTVGGKGFRRRRKSDSPVARWLVTAYVWFCVIVVSLLPLVMIFAASLAKSWWHMPGPLTLSHYAFVLTQDPLIGDVAGTTIVVTVLTVIGTLGLALVIASFVTGRSGIVVTFTRLLGYVPLSVPPIAFTIGALIAYIDPPLALYGSVWILVFTYWARFYPLAAGPIFDAFAQIDPALEESARVAGASSWRSFWQIQLPLVRGVAIAGALIVMVFTVRELLSAVFLQSSQVKMVMVSIFNYWDEGNLERAAAMSSVVIVLCAAVFIIATRFQTTAVWRH